MPRDIATYFTFADFNHGAPSTPQEFRDTLSQYRRDSVVALCSAVNCLLRTWEGGYIDPQAHDAFTRAAFAPNVADLMVRGRQRANDPHLVFHRQQLLHVAKSAALYCTSAGIDPLAHSNWGSLGRVFLMANDHLHFGLPPAKAREQQILNMITEFIPALEISGPSSIKNKTARAHEMSEIASELRDHPDFVDIAQAFEDLMGISVLQFRALCFASMTKYIQLGLQDFMKSPANFFLSDTWFRQTPMQPDQINRFLSEVSLDGESLKQRFDARNAGASDFTPIRDRPMYASGGRFFAVDAAFLADKLETGVFWTVHNSFDDPGDRQRLHRFWGHVFQLYLDRLFTDAVEGSTNRYVASPRYSSDGTEVCDGLVLCGSSAILLEYKGGTFTAESKYSGNPVLLSQAINDKLVSPRGVAQLTNALRRLFLQNSTDRIIDVDLSSIRKIFPVLVTRDGIGSTLTINLLLNRKFDEMFNRRACRPRILTPLFCMDAESLEGISAYLRDARLDDILEARYLNDKSLASTFHEVQNPVIEALGPRHSNFIDRCFHNFVERGLSLLFPGEDFEAAYSRGQPESHPL